jgi:S-adenosylmethionine:tRNA ribosyltransferase-isomerase
MEHTFFYQIGKFLNQGDVLVLNETRVIPARLFARKIPSEGKVELLLLRRMHDNTWEALAGGKGLVPGKRMQIEGGPSAQIVEALDGALHLVQFDEAIEPFLREIGHVPLPPYIHTPLLDPERYQTVYARYSGSAAAPTAGLHFTPNLIASLQQSGVQVAYVTLHVGLDTFAPVVEESVEDHRIHTEWYRISKETARIINQTHIKGGRIVAVGTTSVRALESAARLAESKEIVASFEGSTDLYIIPGYSFRVVDAMITNFHLPRSTLIMLVSAFAGRERVLGAYETAKQMKYRFYSFGDAMLIL